VSAAGLVVREDDVLLLLMGDKTSWRRPSAEAGA
jgi:hypothetical protein